MGPRVIKITVINDLICPFCYIGHKELQIAIDRCADLPVRFDIQYRPFKLVSSLKDDKPVDKAAFYGEKLANPEFQARLKLATEWGDRLGLNIATSASGVISQTVRAHRMSLKAYQLGGQKYQLPFLTGIFHAYCTDQRDIGDINVLAELAEGAGVMTKEDAVSFLQSDELKEEVEKMATDAQTVGVKGVPMTIIDGKWAISGGQSADCYVQIFKKLAAAPSPPPVDLPTPVASGVTA